jgi:hypothetical protein
MKKVLLSAAIAAAMFSTGAMAAGVAVATASGTDSAISGSAALAASAGNGTSTSYGANITAAHVDVAADAKYDKTSAITDVTNTPIFGPIGLRTTDRTNTVDTDVHVSGNTATSTETIAVNTSTGSGFGGAAAGGLGVAQASGVGAIIGNDDVGGVVAGGSVSGAGSLVIAGTNQGRYVLGTNESGFDAAASADKETKTTTTQGTLFGFAVGPTSTVTTSDTSVAGTSALAYSNSTQVNTIPAGHTGAFGGVINGGLAGAGALAGASGEVSVNGIDIQP